MDDIVKGTKRLLCDLVRNTSHLSFSCDNCYQAVTVSFYKKMLSSARAVLLLSNDYYNACILVSHMLEGLILLTWILETPERIRRYADFGVIEALYGLSSYPEDKDKLLNFIKKNNLERLLKKHKITDNELLRPENYYNKWYKPEANDINDMAAKLVKKANHPEIEHINSMYRTLCAYKHYSPYVMLPRYGEKSLIETPDKFIAISGALQSLYMTFLAVNRYQTKKFDIDSITKKYQVLVAQLSAQSKII